LTLTALPPAALVQVVLLGQVQVEGLVLRVARETAEVGVAAIADRDLGNEGVQHRVHDRGREQARVERRERHQRRADHDHRQPHLLVEVALDVELPAVAGGAALDAWPIAVEARHVEGCLASARGAGPAPFTSAGRLASAGGTGERDLGRAPAHRGMPAAMRRYFASSSPAITRKSCT
jgi:hypothetical protein